MEQRETPNTPLIPQPRNDASTNKDETGDSSRWLKLRKERIAYKKLMDHLDDIETTSCKWRKYILRAAALFVFSALVATLVYSLKVHPTNKKRILRLRVWQWVTMAMMLFGVFSVVPVLTLVLSWPFKVVFRTNKYWVYFLRRLKRSVDVTLWSCLVLSGWYVWFRPRLEDVSVVVTHQVTRFLIAFCIGAALWTLKNALYLKLKADLHYDQLFNRISQTVVFLNGYEILRELLPDEKPPPDFLEYDAQMIEDFNAYCYEEGSVVRKAGLWVKYVAKRKFKTWFRFSRKKRVVDGKAIKYIWKDVLRMKRDKVPIWILVRLSKEYLMEVKELRKKVRENVDELINDDNKLLEKAKKMFNNITGASPNHDIHQFDEINEDNMTSCGLSIEDLAYLIDNTQPHAEAERSIHGQANRAIEVDRFLYWAVRVHKKCWGLERTLKSSKSAFVKLNRMLSAFLLVLVVIIWLLLSKIVKTGQLALLFAPFLAASFMFENSSKNMFQGIIFAFAMHPFDVGDRVIIEDIQMRVTQLNILTSKFYKYDTGAEVIFPNSKLATTKIINLDITPDQSDKLDFVIDDKTPLEDIKDLELKLQMLLDENIHYATDTKVVKNVQDPACPKELKMTIHLKYLVSYLPVAKKDAHKSHILSMIMGIRKEMEGNKKEYPLDHKPYILELTANKVKLFEVERFKRHILASLEKRYISKVVMADLNNEKNKIEMALYVGTRKDSDSGDLNDQPPKILNTSAITDENFFAKLQFQEYGFSFVKVTTDGKTIYTEPEPKPEPEPNNGAGLTYANPLEFAITTTTR